MTSDESVYYISKKKENLISQIEKIIERVSIDCSLYKKGNCMKFTQTNEFTFDPDFSYDLSNSKVKKQKLLKKHTLELLLTLARMYYSLNFQNIYIIRHWNGIKIVTNYLKKTTLLHV